MSEYLYNDFVEKLSTRFREELAKIEAEYNFDFGPEFEMAICRVLNSALPSKYGICRGFVVNEQGEKAGDDIIIYAADRFPTIRQNLGIDFSVKEQIPIEAAYSYIEAKHTLVLEGDSASSLLKAFEQVARVKELCSKREPVDLTSYDPYITKLPFQVKATIDYSIRNPMFGAILARKVKFKNNGDMLKDPKEIYEAMKSIITNLRINSKYAPDLIIAGENNVVVPDVMKDGQTVYSQFMDIGKMYGSRIVPGTSFGIGIIVLFFMLDWVRLGKLPWVNILSNALKIPVVE